MTRSEMKIRVIGGVGVVAHGRQVTLLGDPARVIEFVADKCEDCRADYEQMEEGIELSGGLVEGRCRVRRYFGRRGCK